MERYSHGILPVILDWTEQPPSIIILQSASVSCVLVKKWVGWAIRSSVQEVGDDRFHSGDVITPGVVCAVEQLKRTMVS